jgi:hypothetical protein
MAIIRPYQTLLQFSDPAPMEPHIPVLGRTVRPTLSRNPVRYHPPTEDTAQEGYTLRDPLGSISEDTLLRMRATANAQLNTLNSNIEGMIFQNGLNAIARLEGRIRGPADAATSKKMAAPQPPVASTKEEEDSPPIRPKMGLDRVSPRGPVAKPAGFGLFTDSSRGYFQQYGSSGGTERETQSSFRSYGPGTSVGTLGMGGFRNGSFLSFNGNAAALYGRTAMMGGYAVNMQDPVRGISFSMSI